MNITSDVAAFLGVALADAKATNFAELWCPVMGSVTADVRKPSMSSWARHCGPFMHLSAIPLHRRMSAIGGRADMTRTGRYVR